MSKQIIKIAKKVITDEINGLEILSKKIDKSFVKTINILKKTNGKIVVTGVGKSGIIAKKIASTLSSTGTPSQFVHPTEASHGDLGSITNSDCILAISNSGQSNELYDVINYAKRFNIPLLSISSNNKGLLYLKSDHAILFKKPTEACPLNLAPTSSTTMALIIGDAIGISLLKLRGFQKSHFSKFHPGGNLGKDLAKLEDVMHGKNELPLVNENTLMSKALLVMTNKSFGCVGVINNSKSLIGIITDGDLRRNMKNDLINKKASEVMTKKPKVVKEDTLVGEALNLMNSIKITSLFVCANTKPVGIVHVHDLLRLSS